MAQPRTNNNRSDQPERSTKMQGSSQTERAFASGCKSNCKSREQKKETHEALNEINTGSKEFVAMDVASVGLIEQTLSLPSPTEIDSNTNTFSANDDQSDFVNRQSDTTDQEIESILHRLDDWLSESPIKTTKKINEQKNQDIDQQENSSGMERDANATSCLANSLVALAGDSSTDFPMAIENLIDIDHQSGERFQSQLPASHLPASHLPASHLQAVREDTSEDASLMLVRLEENSHKFELRMEQMIATLDCRVNEALNQIGNMVNQLPDQLAELVKDVLFHATERSEDCKLRTKSGSPITEESNWESRKRHMLSEYGLSTDEIEQLAPNPKDRKPEDGLKAGSYINSEDQALQALHSSIESLDKIDISFSSEEIDQLKEQLTAKLREAEIELSINRARLSKEWAAVEQKTAELSQREASLKSKYYDIETTNKKGLLDRFTRHLSPRK